MGTAPLIQEIYKVHDYFNLDKINQYHIAVVWWDKNKVRRELKYHELWQVVAKRSCYFTRKLGLNKGDIVGVIASRGPEYLINMLALWKIGAVYLPLSDGWNNANEIANRLLKSHATCVLTVQETYYQYLDEFNRWCGKVYCMDSPKMKDELRDIQSVTIIEKIAPSDTAYIFSSSGTTGEPKLIVLPHEGILDRIDDHINYMNIQAYQGILGFSDFGIDPSVVEMLLATRSGNTYFVAPQEVRSQAYQALPEFIQLNSPHISVAILLPQVLKGIRPQDCPGLTKIVSMGDKCMLQELKKNNWFDHAQIFNGYGPTETTFGASLTQVFKNDNKPSIHRAMQGISLYLRTSEQILLLETLLGNGNQDVVRGEILIGGTGIGTYIGLPEKVKEKFLDLEGAKTLGLDTPALFLTGDTAIYKAGKLIYRSRIDNQIKNHGFQITLEEIEEGLKRCDEVVEEAIAIYVQEKLLAFIVPKFFDPFTDLESCKVASKKLWHFIYHDQKLERKLRPHSYFWVKALKPVYKTNRKLSFYKSLNPEPKRLLWCDHNNQDEIVVKLSAIWKDLLEPKIDAPFLEQKVSYDLNVPFGDLGGDSLLMTLMIQRVWEMHSNKKTPAPNDFAHAIIINATLSNIQQLLSCYSHKLIKTLQTKQNTLAIYILGDIGNIVLPYTVHQIQIPDTSSLSPTNLKNLLILAINKCRKKQSHEVPYHFISTEEYLLLAYPLAETFAQLGITTYLTVVGKLTCNWSHVFTHLPPCENLTDQYSSWVKELKELKKYPAFDKAALKNFMVDCISFDSLPDKLSSVHNFQMQEMINRHLLNLKHIFLGPTTVYNKNNKDENIKDNIPTKYLSEIQYQGETLWIIGAASTGKTTFLKKIIDYQNNLLVLPLQLKGIQKSHLFIAALEALFPQWQWPILKTLKLLIVIEDYDAISRLDCLDIWTQAKDEGFTQIAWIITCRLNYWHVYQQSICEYDTAKNWQIYHVQQTIGKFTEANLLGMPTTCASFEILEKIKTSLSAPLSQSQLRFTWLRAWFEREYNRYQPLISLNEYVEQAFTSLHVLYNYYERNNEGWLWVGFSPSHWQLQEKIPSVHALPAFNTVLSLFQILNTNQCKINLEVQRPSDNESYQRIVQGTLDGSKLILLRHPERRTWSWVFYSPQSHRLEQHDLPHWVVEKVKPLITASHDGESSLKLIQDLHPLAYAVLPPWLPEETSEFLKMFKHTQAQFTAQGLRVSEIRALQSRMSDDFWGQFEDPVSARYHVLPLQHVPGSKPLFIFHPLTGETPSCYRSLAQALGPHQSIYALQMELQDSFTSSIDKAEFYIKYITQMQPQDSYVLMGWSYGAVLAYQIAILLEQAGKTVEWVINFDSPPPSHIKTCAIDVRAMNLIKDLAAKIYEVPLNMSALHSILDSTNYTNSEERALACINKAIEQINNLSEGDKYQNFCHALQTANKNLLCSYHFANWCEENNPKLNAKLFVFEALQDKLEYLNNADFSLWTDFCKSKPIFQVLKATHFNLFNSELFNHLRPILSPYQRQKKLPLADRLEIYRNQRKEIFAKHANDPIRGIYLEARIDHERDGKNSFPLEKAILDFLNDENFSNNNCFLIQGDPGSGKSHYANLLEQKLWEKKMDCKEYFPLFISLKPGISNYVKTALLNIGMTEEEYQLIEHTLQKEIHKTPSQVITEFLGAKLLVIFDGYDEAFLYENLYLSEKLYRWGAKVIFNVRTYVVDWRTMAQQFGDQHEKVTTYYLQAFNKNEIKNYLDYYNQKSGKTLHIEQIEKIPDKSLLQNPLLLSIAIELWDGLHLFRNRAELFQAFFEKLYAKKEENIRAQEGIRPSVKLTQAFAGYNQHRAVQYWRYHVSRNITALADGEKIPYNLDTRQAQQSVWLGVDNEGRLHHITFWEYHFACSIINAVLKHDFKNIESSFPPLLGEGLFSENISLLSMIKEITMTFPPGKADLLRHHLLLTVYSSKHLHKNSEQDQIKIQAAANAISILNVMQVPFSGLDFTGIRVPYAYLCGALFDTTCLRYANLQNTKLSGVVFRYADLTNADVTGADFGQKPTLHCQDSIQEIAWSPDGKWLAVAVQNSIELWNLQRGKRQWILKDHNRIINNIVFSPDGKLLATESFDTLNLWDMTTSKPTIKKSETNLQDKITTLSFSLNGKFLAVGFTEIGFLVLHVPSLEVVKTLRNYSEEKYLLFSQNETLVVISTTFHEKEVSYNTFEHEWERELGLVSMDAINLDHWILVNLKAQGLVIPLDFPPIFTLSSDRKLLAIVVADEFETVRVALCDTSTSEIIALIEELKGKGSDIGSENQENIVIQDISFRSDAQVIAVGFSSGLINLWNLNSLTKIATFHHAELQSIAFRPNDNFLASVGNDNTIYLWNTPTQKTLEPINNKFHAMKKRNYYASEGNLRVPVFELKWEECAAGICLTDKDTSQRLAVLPEFDVVTVSSHKIGGVITERKNGFYTHWSLLPYSPWLHYQMTGRFTESSPLCVENIVLQNTKLNPMDKYLFQKTASHSNNLGSFFWSQIEVGSKSLWPIGPYPGAVFYNCPPEIFYREILRRLPLRVWSLLANLNKACYAYFGRLRLIAETLIAQVLPVPHHFSTQWLFNSTQEQLRFSFVDAFNDTHDLILPNWLLENVKPFIPIKRLPQTQALQEITKYNENEKLTFVLRETTPRRLVYLLSMSYLLAQALDSAIEIDLYQCIQGSPISLFRVYDLCPGFVHSHLARLIYFLSNHGIFNYDKENQMISLSALGQSMRELSKYGTKDRLEFSSACKITYNGQSEILFDGSGIQILAAILEMNDFSRALHDAALLKLFDAIDRGINTYETLSSYINSYRWDLLTDYEKTDYVGTVCDNVNVTNMLSMLDKFHFIIHKENDTYQLSPLGKYLTTYHSDTLQPTLAMLEDPWWNTVTNFIQGLRDNECAFYHTNDKSFYEYLSHSKAQTKFNRGLAALTKNQDKEIGKFLDTFYDLKNFKYIVDIAGGAGGLLKAIYHLYPHKHTLTLYEQPSVIEEIEERDELEMMDWEWVKGDFSKPAEENNIPKNLDLYLIKGTLHNFDDDQCLQILGHIREAMPPTGELCIIERTLPETNQPHVNHYADLMMMMLLGGRERLRHEWLKLFLLAGFKWINFEHEPVIIEDHNIMICKPSLPEISRSLGFFRKQNSLKYLDDSPQVLLSLIAKDKNICLELGITNEKIAHNFLENEKQYNEEYLNLLLKTINTDPDHFKILPSLDQQELKLVATSLECDYLFLCVNIKGDLSVNTENQWAGIIFDYNNYIIFYFDPVARPMTKIVQEFLDQQNNFVIISNISNYPQDLSYQDESGPYVIAWFAVMLEKFKLGKRSDYHQVKPQSWLENILKLISYRVDANIFLQLRQQQMNWAISYLNDNLDGNKTSTTDRDLFAVRPK